MVHAIRSNLILKVNSFPRSEAEAVALVAEALRSIGAERPTWEEGQPDYTDPRENCAQCGREIQEVYGHKAYRFCSDVCAKVALETRDFERKNDRDRLYAAAIRVINKTRTRARECSWCGRPFHPIREATEQAFEQNMAFSLRVPNSPSQNMQCLVSLTDRTVFGLPLSFAAQL